MAVDDEAAAASSDSREFDCCGVCCAKDDIGAASTAFTIGIRAVGTNNQISEAIAVDVASAADGAAAAVVTGLAVDDETAAASSDSREFDCCGVCGSKDDIGAASSAFIIGIRAVGTNDQIRQTISVHISSAADGVAAEVASGLAVDAEAAAASSDSREFDCCGVCCAKDDIGAARPNSIGICAGSTNDQIREAISVDITSAAD